jgi:hypothetical protein
MHRRSPEREIDSDSDDAATRGELVGGVARGGRGVFVGEGDRVTWCCKASVAVDSEHEAADGAQAALLM